MEPERFGAYTLLRRLAIGGMGEIFLAQRTGGASYHSQLVVKRIRSDLLDEEGFVDMFLDEARVAALIDHPNVVRIHEWGKVEDTYFIAMEYVAGKDLGTLLKRREGPLDLAAALYIMVSICDGLGYAHAALGPDGKPLCIVHRDMTPQNVLVSYNGAVKITDFGIAKVELAQRQTTRAGVLKGKLGYLSPEQARATHIDHRSDIYALGLLLFELTVGVRANPGKHDSEMLFAAAEGRLLRPDQFVPDYPSELHAIYRRATARGPDERFQCVRDFQQALLAFQLERRIPATAGSLAEVMQRSFAEEWEEERRALTPVVRPEDPIHALAAEHVSHTGPRTPAPAASRIAALATDETRPALPPVEADSSDIPLASVERRPDRLGGTQAFSPTQIGALRPTPPASGKPALGEVPTGALHPARREQETPAASTPSEPAPLPARPPRPRRAGFRAVVIVSSCLISLAGGVWLTLAVWGKGHNLGHLLGRAAHRGDPSRDLRPDGGRGVRVVPLAGPDLRLWPHDAGEARADLRAVAPDAAPPDAAAAHASSGVSAGRDRHAARGELRVTASLPLNVFWRGRRLGRTPLTTSLPAGRQLLLLKSQSVELTRGATVVAGGNAQLQVQVGRGKLEVRVRPWAEVEIEGRRSGTTPIQPIELYEGRYTVRLINPAFGEPHMARVTIHAGETTRLVHVFKK